ncbi:TPA_asm: hypothetical protein CBHJFHIM_00021 [Methanobrevibacter gottschalkii virus vir075]|uniref:Uncharacterized protein n=1 Tax=Methanobrevibacter gottschalkii TaxID=190974 RepID=A0A1H7I8T6_9EURY|nr:hypothetical protein [Methanobrevibacter gottschalkii]SEK57920.1 hypothetical protein SAMN05216439_1155 [Methanobrevibacter gottschalkii]
MTRMYERYDDEEYYNVIKNNVSGEIADLLQELLLKNSKLETELHHFKMELRESIKNERTHLGHNALVNLARNLGVDYV